VTARRIVVTSRRVKAIGGGLPHERRGRSSGHIRGDGGMAGLVSALASAAGYNYSFVDPVLQFTLLPLTEYVLWVSMVTAVPCLRPHSERR
jgi:hypothetical protein